MYVVLWSNMRMSGNESCQQPNVGFAVTGALPNARYRSRYPRVYPPLWPRIPPRYCNDRCLKHEHLIQDLIRVILNSVAKATCRFYFVAKAHQIKRIVQKILNDCMYSEWSL